MSVGSFIKSEVALVWDSMKAVVGAVLRVLLRIGIFVAIMLGIALTVFICANILFGLILLLPEHPRTIWSRTKVIDSSKNVGNPEERSTEAVNMGTEQ